MGFSMRIVFDDILQSDTLLNTRMDGRISGYQFLVRLGYYRGLFLSCIETLAVEVDGCSVPEGDILFCLNGKDFEPSELCRQSSEFWNIVEPATIQVHQGGGLSDGEHNVKLTLILRCPYLPLPGAIDPHRYVPIDSSDEQALCLMNGGGRV